MTEDELIEDVRSWKGRADAAAAELDQAINLLDGLLGHEKGSGQAALEFVEQYRARVSSPLEHGNG